MRAGTSSPLHWNILRSAAPDGITGAGYEIDLLDVKQVGTVDLEHLKDLLRPDTICVAVTLVDSELGVVQPVQEIAAILKAYPHCHLHVDATQAVGKIPVSLRAWTL